MRQTELVSAAKEGKHLQESNSKLKSWKTSKRMVSLISNIPSFAGLGAAIFSLKEKHDKLFQGIIHTLIQLKYSTENDTVQQVITNITSTEPICSVANK